MRVGYARVSTYDQNLSLQIKALEKAGCERIFQDTGISGSSFQRPALTRTLRTLSEGDQLIIWKLDRLGRSLPHLISTVTSLEKRRIGLTSISESIDTSSPGGVLVFHIMGALAQFERALISERTKAGIAAARADGKTIGRPKKLTQNQIMQAEQKIRGKGSSLRAIAEEFGVSRTTLYRALRTEDV